jgi:hypothetical protein
MTTLFKNEEQSESYLKILLSLLWWRNFSKQTAHRTFTKSMTKMLSLHIEIYIEGASKSR